MLWHVVFFAPIMDTIEAQGVRLIVDSSSFEMLSTRDPFTPQVPQEEIRVQRVEPVKPPEIDETVIPPPAPIVGPPPVSMPPPADSRPSVILAPLPSVNIAGVVWNTDHPQAIINGQIAGIGDTISGVKIVDIQKMGITVLFQGRTEILELKR